MVRLMGLGSGPGGFGKAVQKGWSIEFRRLVGKGTVTIGIGLFGRGSE